MTANAKAMAGERDTAYIRTSTTPPTPKQEATSAPGVTDSMPAWASRSATRSRRDTRPGTRWRGGRRRAPDEEQPEPEEQTDERAHQPRTPYGESRRARS